MGAAPMALIVRPSFGQPCFECQESVPKPRVDDLRKRADKEGVALLKSSILCVDCERRLFAKGMAIVERRPRF
jgi:hypothetical protein